MVYSCRMLLLGIGCLFLSVLCGLESRGETVHVAKTHDGHAFEYRMTQLSETSEYTVFQLHYATPPLSECTEDSTVCARLYIPHSWKKGDSPRRGVLCLDVLGGNGAITALFGSQFATRGFVVLLPVLPFIGERADQHGSFKKLMQKENGIHQLGTALNQVVPELRRAVDLLLDRPEVCSDYVHVIGASLGSIMTCSLAGSDERVDKITLLLPGGNLRKIVDQKTKEARIFADALTRASQSDRDYLFHSADLVEPLAYAKQLRKKADAGKIMMFNAENDEIIVPDRSHELAEAIGMLDRRRVFPEVGHLNAIALLPQILPGIIDFFCDDTIPKIDQNSPTSDSDNALTLIAKELAAFLNSFTDSNASLSLTAHIVESANESNPRTLGSCDYIKQGTNFRVSIRTEGHSPLGSSPMAIGFGQTDSPWLLSTGGILFRGSRSSTNSISWKQCFSREFQLIHQMATGVMELLQTSQSLDSLRSIGGVKVVADPAKPDQIEIEKSGIKLAFKVDFSSRRIKNIIFSVKDQKQPYEIYLTRWENNVADEKALLEPPADSIKQTKEVDSGLLKRMLGTIPSIVTEDAIKKL